MIFRRLGSVATLIASAGVAAAQAPMPANWSPPARPPAAAPVLVNGSPAPADLVARQTAKSADVKAVSATADSAPSLPAPLPTPAPQASAGAPCACATGAEDGLGSLGGLFDDCAAPYRHVWIRAEYLVWWQKNMALRPIHGTIPDEDASLVSLPDNAIAPRFGGHNVDFGALSGVRLEAGAGIDRAGDWGISGEFFQLEHASQGVTLASGPAGSPTVGPVYFDPVIARQVILLFSDPGIATGTVNAIAQNRMWGFEVDGRRRLAPVFSDRLDLIVGYRHIGFDESLDANGVSTLISPAPSPFAVISYTDHFGVHNDFDGAVIGLESEYDVGRLFLDLRGKFGIGNVHESYSIAGFTNFVSTDPTSPSQHFNGGVLAQPTNSGRFSRNRFEFLGEVTVNGGVRMYNNHVKAYVGYNFLGLSKVLRAGSLVDDVDGTTIPSQQGAMRSLAVSAPAQKVDDGRFWAEGLNFGLAFEF